MKQYYYHFVEQITGEEFIVISDNKQDAIMYANDICLDIETVYSSDFAMLGEDYKLKYLGKVSEEYGINYGLDFYELM